MINEPIKKRIEATRLSKGALPFFKDGMIASRIVSLHIDSKRILILIDATDLPPDIQSEVKSSIEHALTGAPPAYVSFSVDTKPKVGSAAPHQQSRQPMQKKPIPNVKKVLLVASGKGGVGKSTTALNLAVALQQQGLRVGILDADIYGPSLPLMVDCRNKPDVTEAKKLIPLQKYNLSLMSMGFIVDENMPMIWRGPMVQGALHQLLFDVDWGHHGALDVLVIDTPPGTGDVHLTLAQQVIVDGAIIVSTPQDMALIDAKKAISMFNKVSIPVIGLIENMAYFCCPNCGTETDIFGKEGAEHTAKTGHISFLGRIPLDRNVRLACDAGRPIGLFDQRSKSALPYAEIAKQIDQNLK